MKVLVTGGAGYIGGFTVQALKEAGITPIIFDSLETGHKQAVPGTKIYQGNLCYDLGLLDSVFRKEKPTAVIHFAAYIEVGESVADPQKYFFNNVGGTLNLLKAMLDNGVDKIVFSSTASVYGWPRKVPVEEEARKIPTNPYGESKLMVEKILKWYGRSYGLSAIALRYFNAAGAALDGSKGQDYPKPTHLITRACEAALGKRSDFTIYGKDYPTADGTCLRDYIHVLDLASAHLAALKYLEKNQSGFNAFNVGSGKGYSVMEVVEMVKKVSHIDFPVPVSPRRPGDPARLIAKADKIKQEFNWKPSYSDLKTIIESAWKWHKSHPDGYQK
jgi:UDP-glucose 4-epimerase